MPRSADPAKAALWRQRFADFDAGTMSVAQFCQSIACSVASFYQWRRKLARRQPSQRPKSHRRSATNASPADRESTAASQFLPVLLRSSSVVVTLAGGTRFELSCDAQQALLAILEHQESSREVFRSC